MSENYKSRCSQVYNYHRLLSWDSNRGLHVDIFKVPTCCSCQVDGYRETFPPLSQYDKYTPLDLDEGQLQSASNHHPYSYSTIKDLEEEESEDDDDDDYYKYQYAGGSRQQHKKRPGKLSKVHAIKHCNLLSMGVLSFLLKIDICCSVSFLFQKYS